MIIFFFFTGDEADTTVPVEADTNKNQEQQKNYTDTLFESIKHINDYGQEFWYARELSKALEYKDFRNFELSIFKAMDTCKNSGYEISDHFGEVTEMVKIGSGAQRGFPSYQLSRYACTHFCIYFGKGDMICQTKLNAAPSTFVYPLPNR